LGWSSASSSTFFGGLELVGVELLGLGFVGSLSSSALSAAERKLERVEGVVVEELLGAGVGLGADVAEGEALGGDARDAGWEGDLAVVEEGARTGAGGHGRGDRRRHGVGGPQLGHQRGVEQFGVLDDLGLDDLLGVEQLGHTAAPARHAARVEVRRGGQRPVVVVREGEGVARRFVPLEAARRATRIPCACCPRAGPRVA
jgi:hypothetical protein